MKKIETTRFLVDEVARFKVGLEPFSEEGMLHVKVNDEGEVTLVGEVEESAEVEERNRYGRVVSTKTQTLLEYIQQHLKGGFVVVVLDEESFLVTGMMLEHLGKLSQNE